MNTNMMPDRNRIVILIITIFTGVLLSVTAAVGLLYNSSLHNYKDQLKLSAQSQKDYITDTTKGTQESDNINSNTPLEAQLSKILSTLSRLSYLGESHQTLLIEELGVEYTPIFLQNNSRLDVPSENLLKNENYILPDWLTSIETSLLTEVVGSRQRFRVNGVMQFEGAVTAHNSFNIGDRKFLLIEKIDLAEIRRPFIQAIIIALLIGAAASMVSITSIAVRLKPIIEEYYREITFSKAIRDTSTNVVITADVGGYILSSNKAADILFQYLNDSMIGLHISKLMNGFKEGKSQDIKGTTSEGGSLELQLNKGLIKINDDDIHVFIATDITKRKEAEIFVRDTIISTAAVLDTVDDGIFTLNEAGIVQSINPSVEKIFGYFTGEIVGKDFCMLIPRSFLGEGHKSLADLLASGSESGPGNMQEIQGLHKNGHTFPLDFAVNEYTMSKELFYTVVVRDISDRKQAENELTKHRDNLENMIAAATSEITAIVHTAVNSVITIDQFGIIQLFNPSAEKMFGWPANEAIGSNVSIIIPDMKSATHNGYLQKYIESGEGNIINTEREVIAKRRDGSSFYAYLSVGHSDLGEGNHRFIGFVADITDQKNAEHELISAKENAEEAVRVKANFLANMSHEIRTPMNAVIGFSELLLCDSELSELSKQHASTILISGKNLLNIINDILDFSKIEAGRINLEYVCFHLHNATQETIRTLEYKATEKDLSLTFTISPDIPTRVIGDPTRLRQTIINLIGNAIKFTPSGSVNLNISKAEDSDLTQFSITDTGIGMSESQLESVFDAFAQADSSTNRRFGGTGLGTTISKQLIDLMGGKIWAESEEGVGSTFHFTANLEEAIEYDECLFETDSYIPSNYRSPRKFNILLAEDIAANATLATLRLEQQGHTITWVDNGQKALDAATEKEFDLILMDIQMPEMDGIEATAQLRARNIKLPIIALTASVMKEDRKDCFDAGMESIVGKPIDFDELLSTIEAIVPDGVGKILNQSLPTSTVNCQEIDFSPLDGIIHYQAGINRWGDAVVYLESLKDFSKQRANDGKILIDQIENLGDLTSARALAHSLKGLSGNFSIYQVEEITNSLEILIKENEPHKALLKAKQLDKALLEASHAIDLIIVPDTIHDNEKLEFDGVLVNAILDEINSGLDQLDVETISPLMDKLSMYINVNETQLFLQHLGNFDFDSGKLEIESLSLRLGL